MLELSLKETALKVVVVAILGLVVFLFHGFFVNRYLRNQNYIFLSAILPITSLTIVSAIMTNVWLSLGLIGALSIVRFRTPVKSSYELSLIFVLVTTGIVGAISIKGSIFFATVIALIAPGYLVVKKLFPKLFKVRVFPCLR